MIKGLEHSKDDFKFVFQLYDAKTQRLFLFDFVT